MPTLTYHDTQITRGNDCDDTIGDVHPFQSEVCNHFDENCDGETRSCLPCATSESGAVLRKEELERI